AMTMADKIVVMHDGVVEQIGRPLELYDRPRNLFVAGFIGSPAMNLLPGTARVNGRRAVAIEGTDTALPVGNDQSPADGQPVACGVRPEHLELAGPGEDGATDATVIVVEPTGPEILVLLRLGEHEISAIFRERHDFSPGQIVRVRPRAD